MPDLLDKTKTANGVGVDTAYRSEKNEAFMAENGFVSKVHRKKPKGKPMPSNPWCTPRSSTSLPIRRPMAAIVRIIGKARAETKIGMVNLAYNMRRFMCIERRRAPA